jgi:transcriptional regulator with XRE-family HTH domain
VSRREQKVAFGRAVKAARERAGLTQQQLADAAGVRRNMVSQWETGLSAAGEERVAELERILQVPAGDLGWHLGFGRPPALGSAVDAIEADPNLSEDAKRILRAAYEAARTS